MSSEQGQIYLMQEDGDEWVSPTPASTALREAVTDGTDLEMDDIDDIEAYVDLDDLRAVVENGADDLTFTVEEHEVTVDSDGSIDVRS